MRRIQGLFLDNWLTSTRRKPLVIRGARQVGKSTLVRQFCLDKKIELFEINLEKYSNLDSIFSSLQIKKIMEALEDVFSKKITNHRNSLLFLDEMQATPAALPALRYFFEELPDLPVIGAGSLLDFTMNEHEYSMPVGRIDFLYMGPMTFEEFLLAKDEKHFLGRLDAFDIKNPLSAPLHNNGLKLLREYMFTGGMPEAVRGFIESGIESVPVIHSSIIQTYQADFVKYANKSQLHKIDHVFRRIFPTPCRKVIYSKISPDELSRDTKKNIALLSKARVIYRVLHSSCSGIPLGSSADEHVFKTLALDVGLMNFMHGLRWNVFKNHTENEILTEGVIAEQFVGQHLLYEQDLYREPSLYYWLREGKNNNAEVDFIVENNEALVAIEVKAGSAGKIRSLHQWMKDISYRKKKAIRFNDSRGAIENVEQIVQDRKVEYPLHTLPLYCIQKWKNICC
ncbi:MAG: hypothetical protein A2583_04510 [Bdellovibrionales bacterium RIFOXYD1_FULL_53_11]|nr:MAG: hypothetical protein A2583_04510 [Bdellovibrionales bacterium RIFOXYD1_FULL_53_11]